MRTFYIIMILLILFLFFLYRKRKSYYPYSVHSDYLYRMPHGIRKILKNNKLEFPDSLKNDYTVFVKMYVSATFFGYFLHPSVEIETSEGIFRQYVEYGSRGYRYINLSNVKDKTVKVRGKRLRIRNEAVEFYGFKNPYLKDKKILIVAPHPDDAEIAAYGLYEKYAENVFIMTISPGECGSFHYKELYTEAERVEQHLKKGQLRMWNSLTVPFIAGLKSNQMISFGYFNETLKEMYYHQDQEISSRIFKISDVDVFRKQNTNPLVNKLKDGSSWRSLKENISIVIETVSPDIIVTAHPYIDTHEDHQYATIAVLEVLREMNYRHGDLFLYTNHYSYGYYPYGRTGGIMPLPPCFDGSIYYDSLYSHPLNQEEQRNKILAFDAMNDLRPNTDYRFWYRLLARGFSSLRARCFSIEKDYFNMYVRSNELFYLVSIEHALRNDIFKKLIKGDQATSTFSD